MRSAVFLALMFAAPCAATAQTLPHFLRDYRVPESTRMRVSAFADGSLQEALEGGGEPAGSGRLGLQVGLEKLVVQSHISFANSIGQLTEGFGLSILNPASGGAQPAAMIEVAMPDIWFSEDNHHWGWSAYLSLAQADWQRDTSVSVPGLAESAIANVFGLGGYLFHSITGIEQDNIVGMAFGLGPSFRRVYGEADGDFREQVLLTADDTFFGAEGFLALTVNGITAFTQIYAMEQGDIRGLSGLNALFGVTLRGNLFKLDVERD